jgi:hypothetical protein
MATLGRFSKLDSKCEEAALKAHDISNGDHRSHTMIVLGVGGDIVFGPNR